MNETPSRPLSQTAPASDRPKVNVPVGVRTKFPWITTIIALLYGASPIDLIPDVILLLGQTDDAVVIGIAAVLVGRYFWQRKREAGVKA
jgi:uncharacterized membrane protein YkvA (DUF1232 family)